MFNSLPGFILMLTGLYFGLEGCTTREEGCLDVAAANFDFSADRSCEDCCTYPLLSISLSQKWNDRNFSPTDTLFDRNGLPYKINDLKYFLSSWALQGAGQNNFTVDSSEIACPGDILVYTPDIIIVDSRQFQYTLGTIRQSLSIDSIQLKLGLLPALDCIDATDPGNPSVFLTSSVLWDQRSASRAAIRLVLQRNTSVESFDTLYIHTLLDINLPFDLDFKPGISTTLQLTVDYARWFSDIDINDLNTFPVSVVAGVQGSLFKTH